MCLASVFWPFRGEAAKCCHLLRFFSDSAEMLAFWGFHREAAKILAFLENLKKHCARPIQCAPELGMECPPDVYGEWECWQISRK